MTPERREKRRPGALLARRTSGFVLASALTLLLALDGGGYDVVVRAELGMAIWALIAVGLAFGFLPRSRLSTPAWTALAGFAALAVLTTVALDWTSSDERTFAELARVAQYGGVVTLAYLALNQHTWQGAAAGFSAVALIVPLLAVASRLLPDLLPDEAAELLDLDRLSFPLDYWNAVACWGGMAAAVGLCWSAHAERTLVRALTLAAVPVASLSVYLTYSRAGAIAVLLAVLAAIALCRYRWTVGVHAAVAAIGSAATILVARSQDEIATASGSAGAGAVAVALLLASLACAGIAVVTLSAGTDRIRMPRRSARLAAGTCAVAAVIAAAVMHGPLEEAWEEFKSDRAVARGSTPTARLSTLGGTRYAVWSTAIDAYRTDPARGIGPGTYEFFWTRHGDDPSFVRDAHSLYLEQLAELGILGLAATLVALAGLLWAAMSARSRRVRTRDTGGTAALTAAFVVFLFYVGVDWIWEMGAVGTLAIGGIAVVGAGGLRRSGGQAQPPPTVRALAVALAVAVVALQIPALASTERIRAASAALGAGDPDRAARLADDAIAAEPWAATPYAVRAVSLEQAGDLDQAEGDLREAIQRERLNWRHHLLLAQLAASRGDASLASSELAAARRLAPRLYLLEPGSPLARQIKESLSGARREPGR